MNLSSKVVHANATLNFDTLYRAGFDAIKIKLAVALVLCLIFVAATIGLFSYIGEGEILLKLSPLFIGLPFLAIFGQIFRLRAIIKRYLKSLSEAEHNIQFTFQATTDGYDVASGNNFSHFAWDSLTKVVEKPDYFRFYINKYNSHILPKEAFSQAADIEVLREILKFRLSEKAEILST